MLIHWLFHDPALISDTLSPPFDYQSLAALAVSNALRCSLPGHFVLAVVSWADLGVSGVAGTVADGDGASTVDSLASKS